MTNFTLIKLVFIKYECYGPRWVLCPIDLPVHKYRMNESINQWTCKRNNLLIKYAL